MHGREETGLLVDEDEIVSEEHVEVGRSEDEPCSVSRLEMIGAGPAVAVAGGRGGMNGALLELF